GPRRTIRRRQGRSSTCSGASWKGKCGAAHDHAPKHPVIERSSIPAGVGRAPAAEGSPRQQAAIASRKDGIRSGGCQPGGVLGEHSSRTEKTVGAPEGAPTVL